MKTGVVLALSGGLMLTPAFAASIAIASTGNGSTTDGTVDPNWTYTNSVGTTASALVANNGGTDFFNGNCCGGGPWTPDTSASSWIVDNVASPQSGGNPLSFSTTFNLTGLDPASATLSGAWGVDDGGELELNGIVISNLPGQNASNWDNLNSFSVSSGFLPSLNTLSVVLTSNDNAFEGANVLVSGTANLLTSTTPEPASIALAIGGLAILATVLTRRRRKA